PHAGARWPAALRKVARTPADKTDPIYFPGQPKRHRRKTSSASGRRPRIHSQAILLERSRAARQESGRSSTARKTPEARGASGSGAGAARRDEYHGFDAVARNGPEIVPVDDSPGR